MAKSDGFERIYVQNWIFREQKEEIGRKWKKMVLHFSNKFRIYSAQKARHLKNRSFERIYVQNWILEVRVQKMSLSSTFEKNLRFILLKKVHFLRMRFLNEFTFKTAIYEICIRPAGSSKISQL